MKTLLAILISLLGFASTFFAQEKEFLPFNLEENLRRIGSLTPNSTGAIGYDLRYEGIKGSPFMFEEWLEASLLKDGKLVRDPAVKFKIHTEENRIYAQFENGMLGSFPVIIFEEIHLEKEDKTLILRPFRTQEIEDFDKGMRLYEVLFDGSFTLLKKHNKYLKEADYKGAYSQNVRYDEYISQTIYFIKAPEGGYHKLPKLKKKALAKALPAYAEDLMNFAKKHHLNMDKEADVLAWLKDMEME